MEEIRLRFALGLATSLAAVATAQAADVVINNGLAPPNAVNVIDAADDLADDTVFVRNQGCGVPSPESPCAVPGPPTAVEVANGSVGGSLLVYDTSSLVMDGGAVGGALFAHGQSELTLNAGTVGGQLSAYGESHVTVNGGQGEVASANDSSTFTMTGGTLVWLNVYQNATVHVSGGTIGASGFSAHDDSIVVMSGGTVTEDLTAGDAAQLELSGGSVEGRLVAGVSARVTWRGGSVEGAVSARDSSTIDVVGSGFAMDGVPVPYGVIEAEFGTLTGMLESGEPVDKFVSNFGTTGTIALVPEPSPALLLAAAWIAVGGLHRRRRGSLVR